MKGGEKEVDKERKKKGRRDEGRVEGWEEKKR